MITYAYFKHSLASRTSKTTVFLTTLVVLMFASCKDNDGKTTTGRDSTDPARKAVFTGEQLPTLYITNQKANDQLERVLSKANGPGNNLKLVFQFYKDTQDNFRILVVPAGPGNSGYFLTDTVQPLVSNQLNTPLGKEDIFFGDLQLSNQTSSGGPGTSGAIKDLKDHIYPNNSGYQFIWFVPEVVTIRELSGGPGSAYFVRKYVEYKVTSCNVAPLKDNTNEKFTLSTYANPSPPRRLE